MAAAILLLILSPFMLLIAILIVCDSKGPVFYVQPRVGRNGRLFEFIKFRSMYTHLCVGEQYGGQDARDYKQELMESDKNIRQ